jgi:hypothetical protein
MTKFEPLGIGDHVYQIDVKPIENGYVVVRDSSMSRATIYCTEADLAATVLNGLGLDPEFSVRGTGTIRAA